MADVQLEHGFIRIANELFDEILRRDFTKRQTSILLFILRMSYGCQRKAAYIEHLTDFELCGIPRTAITHEIEHLERGRVITRDFLKKEYQINKDFDQWAISYCSSPHIKNDRGRWAEILARNIDLSLYETSSASQNSIKSDFTKNSQTLHKKASACSLSLMKDNERHIRALDKISSQENAADLINLISSKIPYTASSLQMQDLIDLETRLGAERAIEEFNICVDWYKLQRGDIPRISQIINWLEKALNKNAPSQIEDREYTGQCFDVDDPSTWPEEKAK